ncbi:MAG: hypothetical protein JW987_05425 [Anaerolineaceae bacterium]|nr:hypothetical protein [Anaerolineaceae bacterium]
MTPSNCSAMYRIRIEGLLDERWLRNFEDLVVTQPGGAETEIRGMMDQAALHGVFNQIRDLGLDIISVQRTLDLDDERMIEG